LKTALARSPTARILACAELTRLDAGHGLWSGAGRAAGALVAVVSEHGDRSAGQGTDHVVGTGRRSGRGPILAGRRESAG